MDDIKMISIDIAGVENITLEIYPSVGKVLFKDHIIKITNQRLMKLLTIIRDWKNDYGKKDGIDLETFEIVIYGNVITSFHGSGIYPSNYGEFKEWLSDIYA